MKKTTSSPTKKSREKIFVFDAKRIPTTPGCYLFWDKDGDLLYVGKAKNIRTRVRSYFQKKDHPTKTDIMVKKIKKIETRSTSTEIEALILENNLIKEYAPRFNIRLRDDKNFVYLHLTKEEKPKMEIVRRIKRDGGYYLGPKTATKEFKKLIRFCQKFFHIRMVNPSKDYYPDVIAGKYDISDEEYQQNIDLMKRFLNGQTHDIVKHLQKKMMQFASEKNFEAAAKIRDTLTSITKSTEKQRVSFTDGKNRDFIAAVRDEDSAYIVRLVFRHGNLIDQNDIVFKAKDFFDDADIFEAFLMQFYPKVDHLPHEIFLPVTLPHTDELERFLGDNIQSPSSIKIITPQKGDKKKILLIAEKNARHYMERQKIDDLSKAENFAKALPELAEALALDEPPSRIECYDISHFNGADTVASQVVFVDGRPQKSEYRRFKLKNLPPGKIDDFASMNEILLRRFARKDDPLFAKKFPDLIVIDGGKGQLSSVMKAVKEFEKREAFPENFDAQKQIIALAKREEEIFRPESSDPILLPLESAPIRLLQRIRDEAHRFAITFHRSLRTKNTTKSILDEVPGIGPGTKKKLLQTFDSVGGIKKASDTDLQKILSATQFKNLKKFL